LPIVNFFLQKITLYKIFFFSKQVPKLDKNGFLVKKITMFLDVVEAYS